LPDAVLANKPLNPTPRCAVPSSLRFSAKDIGKPEAAGDPMIERRFIPLSTPDFEETAFVTRAVTQKS